MIAVLMGVTATGKTTIARELVRRTGWEFAEGDDYHSVANVAKMKAGTPLTDEDRVPWLAALHEVLIGWQTEGKSGVLTCSALKQSYRDTRAQGIAMCWTSWEWVRTERSKAESATYSVSGLTGIISRHSAN